MGRTDVAKILFKRSLSTTWTSLNPVLANGEPGWESDTGKMKVGDGTTPWNSLGYINQAAGPGSGDMQKSTYDTNNNGIVDRAESVSWSGINNIPTEFTPAAHTHVSSQVTDLQAAFDLKQAISLMSNYLDTGYTTHTHGYLSNATVFSNSNNVTFGLVGSTITASASHPAATSATFSNSNNVTFGVNAGVVTASASFAGGGGGNILAAGTRTAGSNSSVLFSNANGVTFGLDTVNGSIMTASVDAVGGAQTGISGMLLSNTTYTSGTVSFRDGNGVSFASGTGQGISLTHGLQYTSNTSAITANAFNTSGSSNFVLTANSSLLQHTSATSAITSNALHTSASRVINILAATNNTGGGTASLSSNVSFTNANGLTFYTSAGGAIAGSYTVPSTVGFLTTARASNDAIGLNTAQTNVTWTVNSEGISLNAGAYLTTAMQSNAVTLSNINLSAGTTSNNLSAFTMSNANGVSFGLNGSVITASVAPAGGAQTGISAISGGTTQMTSGTAVFGDLNGVSFGVNGNTITASHNGLTTAALSNHSHNFATTTTNGASIIVGTTNSAGVTIGVPAYLTTAQPVGAYLTTARASNDAVGLNTALTGNGVAWTVNSSGISLNVPAFLTTAMQSGASTQFVQANAGFAGTNASGTIASSGISISVNPGGGATPVASASNGSFSFTTLGFSNANNVTFGTSAGNIITASVSAPGAAAENNWVNLIGANTAGNTTASGSTIAYSGINLTLSGTNGSVVNISAPATSSLSATGNFSISVNGSTISMGVPVASLAHWDNMGVNGAGVAGSSGTINIATIATRQNTVHVFPIGVLDGSITANTMMFQMSHSATGNSSSAPKVFSISFGLYTRNGSTLSLLNSASKAYSIAAAAGASTAFSGIRWINVEGSLWSGGAAPTLSAGVNYYGAMVYSSGGNNSAAQTAGFLGFYPFQTAAVSGVFGVSQTTASTLGFHPWLGVHGTTGAIPTTIQLANITRQGASANFVPHIVFNNLSSYY